MAVVKRPTSSKQWRRDHRLTVILGVIFVLGAALVGNFFAPQESVVDVSKNFDSTSENLNVNKDLSERDPVETELRTHVASNASTSGMNDRDPKRGIPRIFHHAQAHARGQSGRIIHDQLLCHAYAWHQNGVYGGACGSGNYDEHEELLASIGLKQELPFACPGDIKRDNNYIVRMVQREYYAKDDSRMWIPAYVEFLKSRVQYPPKEVDKFTIVVHIKRGVVEPCSSTREGFSRYLPNSHYQRLIDKYMQPGARVVIFSEAKSYESLAEFEERGYELHLGHPAAEVWRTIVVSDIVILSRSSFGLIPSVVTNGTVVYTPFWHKPLRGWHVVRDEEILSALDKDLAALKAICP